MPDIQNIPTKQYIGPRIIPHLWDPILWDASTQYDALAVVQYEGVSYIARYVPPQGTLPTNTTYWVRWADFNAQMAQLQQTVDSYDDRITANTEAIEAEAGARTAAEAAQNDIDTLLPKSDFTSTRTVADAIAFATMETINAIDAGFDPTGNRDNTPLLASLADNGNVTIIFPNGVYRFSPCELKADNIALVSATRSYYPISRSGGSDFISSRMAKRQNAVVFAPMRTQDYILKFTSTFNCTIEGIAFSSVGIRSTYDNSIADMDTLTCALNMNGMCMSRIFNCAFIGIVGSAVIIDNSWEVDINNCDFRFISPNMLPNKAGVIEFHSTNNRINCSAIAISNCNIERFVCHVFYGISARVQNVAVSNLIVEHNTINNWKVAFKNYDSMTPDTVGTNSLAMFAADKCTMFSLNVANIVCDNFNYYTATKNSVEYFYNIVAKCDNDSAIAIVIGGIAFDTLSQNGYWYYGPNSVGSKIKKLNVAQFSNDTGLSNRLNGKVGALNEYKVPANSIPQTPTIVYNDSIVSESIQNAASVLEDGTLFLNVRFTLTRQATGTDEIFRIKNLNTAAPMVTLMYCIVHVLNGNSYAYGLFRNEGSDLVFKGDNAIPAGRNYLTAVIPVQLV